METPYSVPNSTIVLRPSQVGTFKDIMLILQNVVSCINVSPLGAGKTVMTLATADQFDYNLVVFAPKTIHGTWVKECKKYNVPLSAVFTYEALTGSRDGFLNNSLLYRQKVGKETHFTPTDTFRQYANSGTLFVFDECHALKKYSTLRSKAATAIAHGCIGTKSRCSFLSGSLADKIEHAFSICRYLGISKHPALCEWVKLHPEQNRLTGLEDVYTIAKKIDLKRAEEIWIEHFKRENIDKPTATKLCYHLTTEIILPRYRVCAPQPKINAAKDFKNGFYDMSGTDVAKLIAELKSQVRFDPENETIPSLEGVRIQDITNTLVAIEKAKMPVIARLVREQLQRDPNCKVVVFCWYNTSLDYLTDDLKEYNPMPLAGDVKQEDREAVMEWFNQPNTTRRLIVANTATGPTGVNLDDRDGRFERHVFCVPSYFFINLYQATGRVYRATTKSKVTLRIVYSRDREEEKIMASLAKKSDVLDIYMGYKDNNIGIEFPNNYDAYYEVAEDATI